MGKPTIINNLFTPEEVIELKAILADKSKRNTEFYDKMTHRWMYGCLEMTDIFSKKLEPIVREVFKDDTAVSAFAFHCVYDSPKSYLTTHVDKHACEYNVSYVISQKEPWAFNINDEPYYCEENAGVFYSGTRDMHGRPPLSETSNDKVEMIFFHFVPKDHWYFNHCDDMYPSS